MSELRVQHCQDALLPLGVQLPPSKQRGVHHPNEVLAHLLLGGKEP